MSKSRKLYTKFLMVLLKDLQMGEEEPGQQWIDLSGKVCIDKENARKDTVLNKGYSYLHDNGRNHEDTLSTYGLAILNDCKYSF